MSGPETPVDEPVDATPPVWPADGAPTPEQIAGRPLVDLTVDELQDVAREVDLPGRSSMKRDELIEALGGDPDEPDDGARVAAAAAIAEAENASAPTVDPLDLMPWERHEDIAAPLTDEDLRTMIAEAQGAITESTIDPDSGQRTTWSDVESPPAS